MRSRVPGMVAVVKAMLGLGLLVCGCQSPTGEDSVAAEIAREVFATQTAAAEGETGGPPPTPTVVARATPAGVVVYVEADGSGDYKTLEEAVRHAPDTAAIMLGPGTFRLEQPLSIDRSLRLYGAGMDHTEIVSEAEGHVVRLSAKAAFAVEGITFRHEGAAVGDALLVEESSALLVARCRFAGARQGERGGDRAGIRIGGTTVGFVQDSVVVDNHGFGILVEDEAKVRLEKNVGTGNSICIAFMDTSGEIAMDNQCSGNQGGIVAFDDTAPTFEGNICVGNEKIGITFMGNAGGVARGNECSQNDYGIAAGGNSQPRLEGNTCTENRVGIGYLESAAGVASGNECSSNRDTGILVAERAQPALESNICLHNGNVGIGYHENAAGTAQDNMCGWNGMHGVSLQGQTRPSLKGNVCTDNGRAGIAYFEQAGGDARANECRSNLVGIYVAATANPTLADNVCRDNATADMADERE